MHGILQSFHLWKVDNRFSKNRTNFSKRLKFRISALELRAIQLITGKARICLQQVK